MKQRALYVCVVLCVFAGLSAGCTPPQEKVQKVVNATVELCKKGQPPFVEIDLMAKDRKASVLREACDQAAGEVAFLDEFTATASVGPYKLNIALEEESHVWMLRSMEWDVMERVRSARKDKEKTAASLEATDKDLSALIQAVPESAWPRLERLDNALELRKKQRKVDEEPGVGPLVEQVLGETVAWSKEGERAEVGAKAQLKVLDSLKKYHSDTEGELGALGSSDDVLIKSIDLAKKEKNKEDQANYEQELAERLAKRPAVEARLKTRLDALSKHLCTYVPQLNASLLKDEKERAGAQELVGSIKCL